LILFHGSNHDFTGVDLSKSKDKRDFGRGFYTTTIKEQALQWGYNMFNRLGGEGIFLYEFDFVQGPVANDKTVLTITGFIDGLYSREEAMRRLRYSKTNDQVSVHTERAVSFLKLREKRKTSENKILYNGQELTFFISQKIEHIASMIAEKENISFDSAYIAFSASTIYKSLQNPVSMLWAENAGFIVDEYYREKEK